MLKSKSKILCFIKKYISLFRDLTKFSEVQEDWNFYTREKRQRREPFCENRHGIPACTVMIGGRMSSSINVYIKVFFRKLVLCQYQGGGGRNGSRISLSYLGGKVARGEGLGRRLTS